MPAGVFSVNMIITGHGGRHTRDRFTMSFTSAKTEHPTPAPVLNNPDMQGGALIHYKKDYQASGMQL